MNENNNEVCKQCENLCPLDELKCGKGRKYYNSAKSQKESSKEFGVNPPQVDLLSLMDQCGHFLYHRKGEKRGQGKILKFLSDNPEMTQKELQDYLNIQPGSMSEIVMKLESKGLISRTKNELDKRENILKITEDGKKTFQENGRKGDHKGQKLFEALEEPEQEELKRLLSKLILSWETLNGENCVGKGKRKEHSEGKPHGRHNGKHHSEHHSDHHSEHHDDHGKHHGDTIKNTDTK